jgi:hypothetical protein
VNFSELPNNYKVYVCKHVYQNQRPVTLVVLEDGDLSFLCGEDDHADSATDFKAVGFGHIADSNPQVVRIEGLSDGYEAELNADGQWLYSQLEQN